MSNNTPRDYVVTLAEKDVPTRRHEVKVSAYDWNEAIIQAAAQFHIETGILTEGIHFRPALSGVFSVIENLEKSFKK